MRAAAAPLSVLNFIMYVIIIALASWVINHSINGNLSYAGGNTATSYFILFAILAGVVGVASKLLAAKHATYWRPASLAGAASTSLITFAITALAMGFACKEIHVGGYRSKRLKALEAFVIICTFTEFFYYLIIHAGVVNENLGPAYKSTV